MTRQMITCLTALLALCLLSGCGGGGTGGSDTPTPSATPRAFLLDFVNNTVTVIDEPVMETQFVERDPADDAAEIGVTLRIEPEGISQPGNVGRRHIWAKLTNRSSGAMGSTGSASDYLELNFTSTVFRDAAGKVVPGGGYAREDMFDPPSGTPIYLFAGSLYSGGTTSERQVDLWLPPTAVTAVVTAIVRCNSERFNPLSLNRFWVSTIAGQQGNYGAVDAPSWVALFGTHGGMQGLAFRERIPDLLVCDPQFNRIRQVFVNGTARRMQVVTVAGNGDTAALNQPVDICEDSTGNVYVSEQGGCCVSLATPALYGSTTAYPIAGVRNDPGDSVGTGSETRLSAPWGIGCDLSGTIYVCDQNALELKQIRVNLPSSRYGSDYQVSNVPMAGLRRPIDIAFDKLGNAFVADRELKKIFIRVRRTNAWRAIAGGGAEVNGPGNVASFNVLGNIAVDAGGIVWVVDTGGLRRLRWQGGAITSPESWYVETIPLKANSIADGFVGVAGRQAIRGVAVNRGGTVFFADDGAVRRLDMTPD